MKQTLLTFALMLLPMLASAAVEKNGIYYNLDNGTRTAEVTQHPTSFYFGNIVIPDKVEIDGTEYRVTSIDWWTFWACSSLISVTIPNGVTSIGNFAFSGCSGLTSITIPNSVTSIGEGAFSGCSRLTSVTIGNSVMSIGIGAFRSCSGLTSIDIPNSVTSIGNCAFENCIGLTSVTIPNSVTSIGEYAFYQCGGLTAIVVEKENAKYDSRNDCNAIIETLSNTLIAGCKNTTIPNSVTSIRNSAFSGCSGLTSVSIPNSVTIIGNGAFSGCSGLNSLTIGNSVTSIGNSAFSGCCSLTSVTIGNSVTNIGDATFESCSSLTSITIPNSVTSIGNSAFYGCSGLTSVSIPNSVTSIGNFAFYGCSSLTSVTIPNSVTSIGNGAFSGCSSLTSVTIPNSVTSIGGYAFSECSGLNSITIPSSVTSIEVGVFSFCSGLTSITIPNSVTSIGEDAFRCCSGLTSITIPNSVKKIGERAFIGCSGLTSITIPNSVTKIVGSTFSGCSCLVSIKVEAGNTKYDSRDNCNAIIETASNTLIVGCQNTIISSSVTSIGLGAFSDCSGLTSITIPDGVTSIVSYAFSGCSGLTSIIIPNSVTSIGNSAFDNCSGLTSLTIGNSVTNIGACAFFGCGSLTSITIPNSVTSIESNAFGYCGGLTSVTIGNSVTSIGEETFYGCSGLLDFYYFAEDIPPMIGSNIFGSSNIANATLHVPAGSVSAYQATAPWNQFGNIVGIEEISGVSLDKTEVVVKKNKTVTLKATVTPETLADKSVTWKSSDTKIATVTSSGKVKGIKTGIATITCTSVATGAKATCKVIVGTITLNKSEVIVKKNKTVTLTPTVYPTTLADKSVKWKSSDKTIATVSSSGKVKGVKTGTATITCTSVATGLSATCKVIVGTITLNKSEVTVKKNKTVTLTPTVYPTTLEDKSVTWKSSDETIATVTSSGEVKGVKYGTATITCTSVATGLSTTCTVTVGTVYLNIAEVTIHNGRSVTLTPTIYPETLEDQSVTWKSSDKTVATVTSDGKVKGVNVGTATITCTSVATGLSSTCKVTVIEFAGARFVYEDDDDVTGIETLDENPAAIEPFDVYDLQGRKVLHQVTSLDGLPAGVYIVNGKKMLKK